MGDNELSHFADHLKFGLVRQARLLRSRIGLLMLQHCLVTVLYDPQCCYLLLQRGTLILLLQFLLIQIANVFDRLLQDQRFAELVTRRVAGLATWHQLLQAVVTLFNGISTLLFRLCVCRATTFLVAKCRIRVGGR